MNTGKGIGRAGGAMETLSSVPYFAGLEPAMIQTIAQAASQRAYGPEQVVILEGDPVSDLYVVQSGWLKAAKIGVDGREQVLQLLGPGEAFNAIGVLTSAPCPATVSALEDSLVWVIRQETMQRLLDEHPALARKVIQDLAGRVLHLVGLVEDLSLRTVEARLARQLMDQAEDGVIQRRRWATQAEMASHLGTVPDVLNRVLRRLVEAGVLQVDRQQIRILDAERLQALTSSSS